MSENILLDQLTKEFDLVKENIQNTEASIQEDRLAAIHKFEELGIPTIKHEEWKYSNLRKLNTKSFDFHRETSLSLDTLGSLHYPDIEGVILYFVNGVYHPELSNLAQGEGKIKIMRLAEAMNEIPEIISEHYGKHSDNENEAFTVMNTALANDGVVVYVPANNTLEFPVIMRMITDASVENAGSVIRNLIVVGENAEVKIAESYRTIGEKEGLVNALTEIVVSADARVDYYKVQDESDASYHIGTTNVYQSDRSYFYSATVTINGGFVRNNLNLKLDGEHIESFMYGLYIPNGKQHVDNHTVVDHTKPNSVSNELYKGILMDNSTGVFNGKIFVRQIAQKTNAYQNCRNVITSPNATMNTKPQLEIWADDVKCSHGTTTGQLNDEAIFYMQSRGIPKSEAIRLQLLAFAEDVVSQIKIESLRDYLAAKLLEKLG